MLIILSPAKTMNMSLETHTPEVTTPIFNTDAEYIANKMKKYSEEELAKLFKISPILAKQTYECYKKFDNKDTPSKAALFVYNGSVFKNISLYDFTKDDIRYAQHRIRIISTLYGLIRPLDLIKAYRITYKLRLDGISGTLYDYWQGKLTEHLIKDIREVGDTLVNLASLDIQAALDMEKLKNTIKIITPEFKDLKNGQYKTIRTYVKIARGAMTRYIIKERIETPEALKLFKWNGYKFDNTLSDENNYIYTRQ